MIWRAGRRLWIAGVVLVVAWGTEQAGAQEAMPPGPAPLPTPPGQMMGGESMAAPLAGPARSDAGCPGGLLPAWYRRLRGCFLGLEEEFEAPPPGSSMLAFGQAQVANADAAQLVLYQCDFLPASAKLSPRGAEHLARLVQVLCRNFCPLIVEATPCAPELDEARRLLVVQEAARCGFAVPPERVVIGKAPAFGLSGVEAALIYNNLLNQTQSGGRAGAGGGGGAIRVGPPIP